MCCISFLYIINTTLLEMIYIISIVSLFIVGIIYVHHIMVKKSKKRKEQISKCPYLNNQFNNEQK